jgi:hypothetical protein
VQAIEELARISIEQVLKLLVGMIGFNLKLNIERCGVPKTRRRAAGPARTLTSK